MHFPPITFLVDQTADWFDLSIDFQLAALDVWKFDGYRAKNVFCLGA